MGNFEGQKSNLFYKPFVLRVTFGEKFRESIIRYTSGEEKKRKYWGTITRLGATFPLPFREFCLEWLLATRLLIWEVDHPRYAL